MLICATWVVALIWFVLVLISVCTYVAPVVLLRAASYCTFAWSYYIRFFFGAVVAVLDLLVDSASCLNNNNF